MVQTLLPYKTRARGQCSSITVCENCLDHNRNHNHNHKHKQKHKHTQKHR